MIGHVRRQPELGNGEALSRLFDAVDSLSLPVLDPAYKFEARPKSRMRTEIIPCTQIAVGDSVWGCVIAAWDHLHALRQLFVEARSAHTRAPWTLLRMALERLAVALWLLTPERKSERALRHLYFIAGQAADGSRLARMTSSKQVPNALLDSVIAAASRTPGVDEGILKRPDSELAAGNVLGAIEHVNFGNVRNFVWSGASAVSHGSQQAVVMLSQVERGAGSRPEIDYVRTALSDELFELAVTVVLADLAEVMARLSNLGGTWRAWRPDEVMAAGPFARDSLSRPPIRLESSALRVEQAAAFDRLTAALVTSLSQAEPTEPGAVRTTAPGFVAWHAANNSAAIGDLGLDVDPQRPIFVSTCRDGIKSTIRRELDGPTHQTKLRLALAALLDPQLRLAEGARISGNGWILHPQAEARLSRWMRNNLVVSVEAYGEPQKFDARLLHELAPALDRSAGARGANAAHLRAVVRAFRARVRGSARTR